MSQSLFDSLLSAFWIAVIAYYVCDGLGWIPAWFDDRPRLFQSAFIGGNLAILILAIAY